MNTRKLGKTGFEVSEIGLGCWQLGGDFGPISDDQGTAILRNAFENGVDFWDTADVYGDGRSEHLIGNVLSELGRGKVRVATKVGRTGDLFPDGYSKEKVHQHITESAQRLGVEQIDLVQLHCVPKAVLQDGEIFTWLQDFQHEGLIAHYGASVEKIEEGLLCLKDEKLATLQIIFNIFRQNAIEQLLPEAHKNDVGIIVRLPLASGLLSGKFSQQHEFSPQDHRNFNCDGQAFSVGETFSGIPFDKGVELAGQLREYVPHSVEMAQFALRWILDHPQVSTVIAGVSRPDQLQKNCGASRMQPLSDSLHKTLLDFYKEQVVNYVRGGI